MSNGASSDENELATSGPTVLLADGQVPTRTGIKRAIEPHGLRVVAEASNAEEAVRMAAAKRPDICVISVTLAGNGLDAARQIKHAVPTTKIVMMAGAARDEDMLGALRAGADGYLLLSTPASRLPHAILGVMHGEAALPRTMTARLILEFRERGTRRRLVLPKSGREVELTAREAEVLDRLRRREPTAEIATRLGISEVTVRRHTASVLQKLGTPNRRSAIEMLEAEEELAPESFNGR
ncbi:MAG TPA: response regulator transcription factor [Solirubrobacteraceae bacterium]|nr:response regulator transcription factor [Solirubrobacteraceae bacterium]